MPQMVEPVRRARLQTSRCRSGDGARGGAGRRGAGASCKHSSSMLADSQYHAAREQRAGGVVARWDAPPARRPGVPWAREPGARSDASAAGRSGFGRRRGGRASKKFSRASGSSTRAARWIPTASRRGQTRCECPAGPLPPPPNVLPTVPPTAGRPAGPRRWACTNARGALGSWVLVADGVAACGTGWWERGSSFSRYTVGTRVGATVGGGPVRLTAVSAPRAQVSRRAAQQAQHHLAPVRNRGVRDARAPRAPRVPRARA